MTPVCAILNVTSPDAPPPVKPVPATTLVTSPWGIACSTTLVTIPFASTVILALLVLLPYVPAVTPLFANVVEGVPTWNLLVDEL